MTPTERFRVVHAAARIVRSYLAANQLRSDEVPLCLRNAYVALAGLPPPPEPSKAEKKPAVPLGKSVTHSHIVCVEDGRRLSLLTRHLKFRHNLGPDEYRQRWGLPAHYPMVAPSHKRHIEALARRMNLVRPGTKRAK